MTPGGAVSSASRRTSSVEIGSQRLHLCMRRASRGVGHESNGVTKSLDRRLEADQRLGQRFRFGVDGYRLHFVRATSPITCAMIRPAVNAPRPKVSRLGMN